MAEVNIKTEKGVFVAHDLPCDDAELLGRMDDFNWSYSSKTIGWGQFPMRGRWRFICKLSQATEEQAKVVVDTHVSESINTHLMKLHYVLKSKGVDLNNGNWYLFQQV